MVRDPLTVAAHAEDVDPARAYVFGVGADAVMHRLPFAVEISPVFDRDDLELADLGRRIPGRGGKDRRCR